MGYADIDGLSMYYSAAMAPMIEPSPAGQHYAVVAVRPVARLAVLPGRTHYDVIDAPGLVDAVVPFLDEG